MVTIRTRSLMWFAAALTLGVAMVWTSTVWRVDALPGPDESTIVNVTPERVLDTRDPSDLGLPGPFMSQVPQKLQITGSIPTATGTKTVVPTGATGVLLNVTGFNPSANGFISIRPGDAVGAPTTSSLNILAGEVVPNAVQVSLPTAGPNEGQIDIVYDALGVVGPMTDIFIDVVGYTTNTGLQDVNTQLGDRYTKAEVDQRLPIARSARHDNVGDITGAVIVLTVTIEAPVAGLIQAVGSALIDRPVAAGLYICRLSTGTGNLTDSDPDNFSDTDRFIELDANEDGFCSTNGAISVAAGTHVVNFVLDDPAAAADVFDDATLDVLFVPGGSITSITSSRVEASGGDD